MDGTIIQQGTFTSTATNKTIVLRSDVDWMRTYNLTTIGNSTQWDSTEHYWQRGMAVGQSILNFHAAATQVISTTTSVAGFNAVANRPAFYLLNSATLTAGAAVAVTAGTNATQPVYSTGNTGFLAAGSIVRVYGTDQTNVNGLDFSVDTIVANTSFRLANTISQAPGLVAGANGFWRYLAPDIATYKMFYPSNRVIANITQANPAVVTTLVDHGYTSGQAVRIKIPAGCGMVEMNDLIGTVTNVNAATFSVNIDATAFSAFTFPLAAASPFTPAQVIPVGESLSLLTNTGDAKFDQSYIGMILGSAGAVSGTPTGVNGDVIYWVAGKSFNM